VCINLRGERTLLFFRLIMTWLIVFVFFIVLLIVFKNSVVLLCHRVFHHGSYLCSLSLTN